MNAIWQNLSLFLQLISLSAPTKSFKLFGKTINVTLANLGADTAPLGQFTISQALTLLPVILAGVPLNEQFRVGAALYQLTITVS